MKARDHAHRAAKARRRIGGAMTLAAGLLFAAELALGLPFNPLIPVLLVAGALTIADSVWGRA
jgi:hypothetical protein